ncbi:UxaA family hydrolase [Teredinibacter turnerae]|uniref:UxaA family hydrolase n=1 Tax=Teredinibacter turnerae TaxID=2426 RepID=UPI000366AF1F|nr:altronate dehydratase family protein [Teredinibacter turnerae]
MNKTLRLDSADNVAVALTDLQPGELVSPPKSPTQGAHREAEAAASAIMLEIREQIPMMHKVAVTAISQGDTITKFGQVIGVAAVDILPGSHVHYHNCVLEGLPANFGSSTDAVMAKVPTTPANQRFFRGFRRANGRVGTRNFIGILTSVNCSATVAKQIAAAFSHPAALQDYPNVDGVIALTHESGCGMRAAGEGFDALTRTLEGYVTHPNFGGVLMVGLGCETMQVQGFLSRAGLQDSATFSSFNIQEVGGTRAAIEKGVERVKTLLTAVNAQSRQQCPLAELTLAVQCGGSDGFSGITANPALGVAADLLVQHGGNVIYSETPEIFGAEHLLKARAVNADVAAKLSERIDWWQAYTRANGFELNNNPSPGNKAGGLSTILEKSLGAQAKGGTSPLTDVLLYAEQRKTRGLVFMDSPGYDPVSVTGQVASGANIIGFTTGRGSAFGFKPVPCFKLSSNTRVYDFMKDDIDINCGTIIDGEQTLTEVGAEIFEAIIAIASGEQTKSETLGYGDSEFCPWKIGAVV